MTDYQYQSESVAGLMKALAEAQGLIQNVTKASVNPHFKSSYADMAAVRAATFEVLSAKGIAILQPVESRDGQVTVTTELRFGDEFKRAPLSFPLPQNIQAFGSLISYLKRYGQMSMLGLAAEDDDDDGNKAKDAGNGKSTITGPISLGQAEEIKMDIVHSGADLKVFLDTFRISRIEEMPAARFAEAKHKLDLKLQQTLAEESQQNTRNIVLDVGEEGLDA